MPILIQLIAGGAGGNVSGALLKKFSLGPVGNTIAGALGGLGGGQLSPELPGSLLGAGHGATAVGSGIGGIVLTLIVGVIKKSLMK